MGFLDRITGGFGGRTPDLLDGNFDRPARPPKPPKEASAPVDPKRMQPDEIRYGYIVAAVLIVVAVVNMTVTTGKGAPKNPPYLLSAIGIVLALAMIVLMRAHRRMLAPFAAVASAFCVTFGKTPNSLVAAHLVAIIAPVIWAFWVTQRSNKAIRAERIEAAKAKREARQTGRKQGASQPGGRGRRKEAEQTGPAANRRYTPPKTKPRTPATPAARGSAKSGSSKANDAESGRTRFRRLSRGTG